MPSTIASSTGKLAVVDRMANRVLIWNSITATIKGTGFKSLISQGVALDANGLPLKVVILFGFNGQTLSYVDDIVFKKTSATTKGLFGFK